MKEYDVTITETLKMTVTVKAESQLEAEQIVSDNWRNHGTLKTGGIVYERI